MTTALVIALAFAAPDQADCSRSGSWDGGCVVQAEIENGGATLSGSGTGSGSGSSSGNNSGNGNANSDPTSTTGSNGGTGTGNATAPCPVGSFGCPPRDDYDVIMITLDDIARFRPAPGIQRMEPDGWVVVGLPANIYSLVSTQIVPGELLGQSADVRFTPIGWQWRYGDGTAATLSTKGTTWAAQGLREFDATPTSHIYRQAGSYTIRLNIVYRAEYRIAGGTFIPIAGTLTLPANDLHITATGAKTVLVDRDCTVAPYGPGC